MAFYDSPGLLYDSGVLYDSLPAPQPTRRRMAKIKLGLGGKSPEDKVAQAVTIKTAMTGNATFGTPNPTLAAYGTATTTAQTKINAVNSAKAALEVALADRDAAIAVLDGLTVQMGSYVDNIANGDRVKIESAGFPVRAEGAPITLTQVLNLVLTSGDFDGTLDVSYDPTHGATGYEIWTSTDPVSGTSWVFNKTASKSSDTIPGLTSGAKLWVRVRATGANSLVGPWSDPATKTVP